MGEPRHARFAVSSGGARTPAVAFGCAGAVRERAAEPAGRELPPGAKLLERRRIAAPGPPASVAMRARDDRRPGGGRGLPRGRARGGRAARSIRHVRTSSAGARTVLNRLGQGPLAVLADAQAAGSVLAVCADVPPAPRGPARARSGASRWPRSTASSRHPELAASFEHLVALDPPSCPGHDELLHAGSGFTHLAWGEAELRFAQQMHELEYGLRASLVALYRSLRLRRERPVRNSSACSAAMARPVARRRLAGRLIRVLAELELVLLDRSLPALAMADGAPTRLERSPAYRAYATSTQGRTAIPEQRKPAAKRLTRASSATGSDGASPPASGRRRPRVRAAKPRGAAATLVPTERAPVDRVPAGPSRSSVVRNELTATERRLLCDLFAIVEEHADHAAVVIDRDQVEEAFVFAFEHHADQLRKSGEDFIIHPVGVAKICAGMRLDTETLCAALLHDTVEDTSASLEEVREAFGEEIAEPRRRRDQARGAHLPVPRRGPGGELPQDDGGDGDGHPRHPDQARRPRSTTCARSSAMPPSRSRSIRPMRRSTSTRRSPTGSGSTRSSGSSRTWPSRPPPAQVQRDRELVAQQRVERESYINDAGDVSRQGARRGRRSTPRSPAARSTSTRSIHEDDQEGPRVQRDLRPHRLAGDRRVDQGLLRRARRDPLALEAGARALQGLHRHAQGQHVPVAAHHRDRSRGRAARDPDPHPRRCTTSPRTASPRTGCTRRGRPRRPPRHATTREFAWLRSAAGVAAGPKDPKEFLETLKVDLFEDEVFVFTPKGEVKPARRGVDAARLRLRDPHRRRPPCVGAKVNGKIVPLRYQLRSGDIVEVLTSKRERGPSRDWLALVKTTRARNKIKAWFKAESRETPSTPAASNSRTRCANRAYRPRRSWAPRCSPT